MSNLPLVRNTGGSKFNIQKLSTKTNLALVLTKIMHKMLASDSSVVRVPC